MKKLIVVIGLLSVLYGCYDEESAGYEPDDCTPYSDLCADGSNIRYYICCSPYTYDCWWEVGDQEYYSVDYMWSQECEK